MPRVKRGRVRTLKRRRLLNQVKGYHWGKKKKVKLAKEAIRHAGAYSLRDRRSKKRSARRGWNVQINAGARQNGMKYSVLVNMLKKKNIRLDRKILAALASEHPLVYSKLIKKIQE